MKDYRLSEIQNHNWNELWDLSDDIAKRRLEFEFLRKAQYSLEHLDIEPRDMIELPYKDKIDEGLYKVLWRQNGINGILISIFNTEAEADAFIREFKNGV